MKRGAKFGNQNARKEVTKNKTVALRVTGKHFEWLCQKAMELECGHTTVAGRVLSDAIEERINNEQA